MSTFAIPNEKRWVRITVSTQDSQSCNRSSILLPSTKRAESENFLLFFHYLLMLYIASRAAELRSAFILPKFQAKVRSTQRPVVLT